MNNVTLIGNVCRDAELRQTASGQSVASTTIAVKRDRKETDGTYKSDFFDLIIWGNQANYTAEFIKKGDKVAVAGNIQIREYVTKQGVKGKAIEVIVSSIENLEKRNAASDTVKESEPDKQDSKTEELSEDELPF